MKKVIFLVAFCYFSFSLAYEQMPEVELDALSVFELNSLMSNTVRIHAYSSGTYSAGLCYLLIRASYSSAGFAQLTSRLRFFHSAVGGPEEEVNPIVTDYAVMFRLMDSDFGFEKFTIKTKDGRSIGQNISELFNGNTVAAIMGTCYSR